MIMLRVRSLWSRATLPAAMVLLAAGLVRDAGAQRVRRPTSGYSSRVDTTFAFSSSGTVTVRGASGDITVTGWSRNEVHVRAVSDDDNIRFDASSSRLTLETAGSHRGSDTKFEVSVPFGAHVIAYVQSGEITIRGTRGEVEAHAQSGDVHLEDVTNRLDVNTLSGDVTAANVTGDVQIVSVSGEARLSDVRGNVDVSTVSGDIALRGVTAKLVRAKTTSGDVTYDGIIDPAGRYEFGAHSGDIHLHVPRDASAQLSVSTWSGGIDSDFSITLKPGEQRIGKLNAKRFTFEIGGGAARITAETFSGDISIASNGRGASDRR